MLIKLPIKVEEVTEDFADFEKAIKVENMPEAEDIVDHEINIQIENLSEDISGYENAIQVETLSDVKVKMSECQTKAGNL